MDSNNVKGIVYDLDGTIIDTAKLHEIAWTEAGRKYGIEITLEMLEEQKGMPSRDAAIIMLGLTEGTLNPNDESLIRNLTDTRRGYVLSNIGEVTLFSGFLNTYKELRKMEVLVGVCTSASELFLERLYEVKKELLILKDTMVYKGMYKRGKPDAEPVLKTLEMMNHLQPQQALYIGDAHTDYLAAMKAGVSFILFCPDETTLEDKIPKTIPRIQHHEQVLLTHIER